MRKSLIVFAALMLACSVAMAPNRASATLNAQGDVTVVKAAKSVEKFACVWRRVCARGVCRRACV